MESGPRFGIGRYKVFYGWAIVGTSFLVVFSEAPTRSFLLSLFVVPITEEFGWTRSVLTGAVSMGAALSAVLAPGVGPLIDRYGPRMVIVGSVAITGSCILGLAFIDQVWHLYFLLIFARAFSSSAAMMAATVAVANWFIRKRGRAMAFSNSGTWTAIPIFLVVSQLLISLYDWRVAMFTMGVTSLVLAIPATLIFMKRRPEDVGLLPDGDVHPPGSIDAAGRRRPQPLEASWSLREAMGTRALWLIILATGLPSMAAQAANLHALASLTDRGIPTAAAAGTVTVTLLVSGVGTLFWGFLAERLHVRFTAALAFFISAVGLAILIYAGNIVLAFLYAAVYGLGFGGFRVLENMLFANYFGRRRLGTIAGFAKPFHLLTNAAGPLLASLSFDLRGSYTPAFILFSLAYLFASIALLLATPPKRRPPEPVAA